MQGDTSRLTRGGPPPPDPSETAITAIRKTLAVAAVVLAGTVACGTAENLTAAQKLDKAVDKLGQQTSLSFELGLDSDAATLKALDSGAAPGEEMPDQVAELLAGARVSVSVQSKSRFRAPPTPTSPAWR